ncbi:hypothetical protein MAPG_07817 [Magnaporthiopsis poae ATCC 64411]|uniref:Uncharacterized protein n=1 Tax=Magnaporthiopsis poae (strain ATCC 64411 / 73-15) TaxID=644358 RepID=A0A0C4E5P3_MAGP6|nr:hypothetical protein MAPG_07817 [Magnaporthiopsis poae ATCC 64411]
MYLTPAVVGCRVRVRVRIHAKQPPNVDETGNFEIFNRDGRRNSQSRTATAASTALLIWLTTEKKKPSATEEDVSFVKRIIYRLDTSPRTTDQDAAEPKRDIRNATGLLGLSFPEGRQAKTEIGRKRLKSTTPHSKRSTRST